MNPNLTDIVNNLIDYIQSNDTEARDIEDLSDILTKAKRETIIPKLGKEEYSNLIKQTLFLLKLKFIVDEKDVELVTKSFRGIDEEIDYNAKL